MGENISEFNIATPIIFQRINYHEFIKSLGG